MKGKFEISINGQVVEECENEIMPNGLPVILNVEESYKEFYNTYLGIPYDPPHPDPEMKVEEKWQSLLLKTH